MDKLVTTIFHECDVQRVPQRVPKYLIFSIKVHILMINSENTTHIELGMSANRFSGCDERC